MSYFSGSSYGGGTSYGGNNSRAAYGSSSSYSSGSAYGSSPARSEQHAYSGNEYQARPPAQYGGPHESIVDTYLEDNRPWTPIVTELGEIQSVLEQAFEKITGQPFPREHITITIQNAADFEKRHPITARGQVVGYSINNFGKGVSTIVVKQDHLDAMLLTLGHEIGHVLSPTLPDKRDEEAKAHAFSIAWMETIRNENIAGLAPNIRLNPARNGLHDVALDFVNTLRWTGNSALDIFKTIANGATSITHGGTSW
ncbi:hypothetical protein C4580_00500 [Candidatus Woesearchaeota archaeon]|nr:MAG: hypothetical protein C4580_00500 [Candidatus Woesearchaeota archaeon]